MELFILIITLLLNLSVVVVALLFIIWLLQSILFKAPFVPLPRVVVEKVVQLANLSKQDKFYDLGSGDGRVVRAMAISYPTAICIGVEKALVPNLIAWFYQVIAYNQSVVYYRQDFTQVSLQSAKVVFLYLWPSVMAELANKLRTELPAGATIIACRFELPGFSRQSTHIVMSNKQAYRLYVYTNNNL